MNADISRRENAIASTRIVRASERNATAKNARFWRVFSAATALLLCALLSKLALFSQPQFGAAPRAVAFRWKEHREYSLPPSMRVYEGIAPVAGETPLRAWRIDIDWGDAKIQARAALSNAPSGKESASSLARKIGATVAINGGYFDMGSRPARTFSLVQNEGRVLARNIALVPRGARRFPVTRSAFGIDAKRGLHIDWIAHVGEKMFAYDEPAPHRTDFVASAPTYSSPRGAQLWAMQTAIGAGPILLRDGRAVDSYESEVFWKSGFPKDETYTRAAIGFTAKNRIVLFATDGRSRSHFVGLTLSELTQTMQQLGCVSAMNLDGGGSETLVVNSRAINFPSDGREREITSILGFSASGFTQAAK